MFGGKQVVVCGYGEVSHSLIFFLDFSQVQQPCLHVLYVSVYNYFTVLWRVGGERLLHRSKGPRSHCVHHRD